MILASFRADFWYAFLAGTDADPRRRVHAVAGEARDLRPGRERSRRASCTDVNGREFVVLGMLAVAVLLLGVWPAPLLDVMRPTVEHLVQQITVSKL